MRKDLLGILLVLLTTATLTACGGAEGNETDTATLSDLTADQIAANCARFDSIEADFKGFLCTAFSINSPDPASCESAKTMCLAAEDEDEDEACFLEAADLSACTATVADLNSCIDATAAQISAANDLISCDIAGDEAALEEADEALDDSKFAQPAECAALEAICPGIFDDDGDDPDSCDPLLDEECVCTDDEDGSVVSECTDGVAGNGDPCSCEFGEDVVPSFQFVLLEDETANPSGDFPGADIDAVSVIKASGDEFFAASFSENTELNCNGSVACDPNALLGAPDVVDVESSECFDGGEVDPTLFTALNGGSIVLGFSQEETVTIENGDSVHVFEVGATECGRFDDDTVKVSVSISDDVDANFIEIGSTGVGNNIVPVTGL